MNEKVPMTADGMARLEEELRHLKSVARPEVIRSIAEAREHGDLSENAEYHAARERQSFIEGRVAELGQAGDDLLGHVGVGAVGQQREHSLATELREL